MASYCGQDSLTDYLVNMSDVTHGPVKSVVCPFVQDAGAGMGLAVFSLLFFGGVGLGLTIRTQHPAPVFVAGILSLGTVALSVSGQAMELAMIVVFFTIAGGGIYLYARAQRSL